MAGLYSQMMRAPPIARGARTLSREGRLQHLAALGRALAGVGRLGPALALAGILALAGGRAHLAGAGALASVGARTLHALCIGSGSERAGGEQGGGSGDDGLL